MGSNPVQAWIFFRLLFQLFKLIAHCEDQVSLIVEFGVRVPPHGTILYFTATINYLLVFICFALPEKRANTQSIWAPFATLWRQSKRLHKSVQNTPTQNRYGQDGNRGICGQWTSFFAAVRWWTQKTETRKTENNEQKGNSHQWNSSISQVQKLSQKVVVNFV